MTVTRSGDRTEERAPAYGSTARLRVRQAGVLLLGLVAAAVMIVLGWWQLGVYTASGERAALERSRGAPVPVTAVAPPGAPAGDGFGRSVRAEGRFDPDLQLLVPIPDSPETYRVANGLRLSDGGVLVVVRGQSTRPVPPPPAGLVVVTGVLLPSEEDPGSPAYISLPHLAQTWPRPLVSGILTADAATAREQGLPPSEVVLPPAPGRLRNGAYALQWWLFAGFALLFAVRVARDLAHPPLNAGHLDENASRNDAGSQTDPT